MFKEINISNELKKNRSNEQNLIDEAYLIVKEAEDLASRFTPVIPKDSEAIININRLEIKHRNDLFSTREIKKFCVNYHMRFLFIKNTKFEIDKSIILKVYEFEEQYNVRIKEFYLMISEDIDGQPTSQPSILVFGKLSINCFIFFGSYGTKLTSLRKIKYFPLQSIYAFAIYNFLPSFFIAFIMPYDWLQTTVEAEWSLRLWFSFHIYIALFGFSMFIGALGNMRFSDNEWDNPFGRK